MTYRTSAYALAAALLLTGCTPQVSQTVRAGNLQVDLTTPTVIGQRDLYPIRVTYTNLGQTPLSVPAAQDCFYIWNLEDALTGQVPQPEARNHYGCHSIELGEELLPPKASLNRTFQGVISRFPAGEYKLGDTAWYALTLGQLQGAPPQELRFHIR